MKIFKKNNFKKLKWKNGLGFTEEIFIYPTNSSVEQNNFDLRLTKAQITSDGPFSFFPGYSRLISVFEGKGFFLNINDKENLVTKSTWVQFEGEDKCSAKLVDGNVTDLNFFWNKEKFEIETEVIELTSNNFFQLSLIAEMSILMVLNGSLVFQDITLNPTEALFWIKGEQISVSTNEKFSKIIIFKAQTRQNN